MKIYPVIMAGGSGTRFWPLSRRNRPKQFLALAGDAPLLAATVSRLPPLSRPRDTFVVCGPKHAAAARRMVAQLPKENFIVEPCARNTAPCVGLAAIHVAAKDPRGVIAMLPADHHIGRPPAFRDALAAAAQLAEAGSIATIGIRPSRPETGYGYLKLGPRLAARAKGKKRLVAHKVERFVEKPDVVTAARYLADGSYLWNSGIFVFRADVILDEIRRAMPVLGEQLEAIRRTLGTPNYARTLKRVFPDCPSISIDYGVMEKSQRIAVVPAEFGWSDVGSFAALSDVRVTDDLGNVAEGDALVIDGRNNVVLAGKDRPIALIGLDDVIVVDSGDALLVCRRDRAQDVRKAVEELGRRGREELL
ncbi:Mannose-1-phosphate guanylyltransferase (GDP) [Anaeromyxobacter sp. K]|uniref:mannose-1-phosphate guanylyltransferase n=1 Tax=Anaeromyxobacter dehalogenans (strain ATCC BAA-258 / DSM 21875 / 2CP-1) TaxID=455488 RepID=B8J8T8_ANAD2|nr:MULTISPECIES: mannose-1-phosphate guanylyltransferase [Anaeromyxobacter]ACG71409.1 Mannose-1-phosphate guanylyltransferase (GDP) [Anaeromyxobacter sp. K]ACL63536.1 Mannose-1-phosphate guanylyltransferase (GDP) [Anaeromyxobacter dehalogenans 2CP-1]